MTPYSTNGYSTHLHTAACHGSSCTDPGNNGRDEFRSEPPRPKQDKGRWVQQDDKRLIGGRTVVGVPRTPTPTLCGWCRGPGASELEAGSSELGTGRGVRSGLRSP